MAAEIMAEHLTARTVLSDVQLGWSLYGWPPSALVAALRGWGQLQRSCLRAPL
jgi:hypothetical protein